MDGDSKRRQGHHKRRLRLCALITVASVILLAVILLILALTVFKPRHAVTTVNSVKLTGLTAGLDVPRLSVDLNVTLSLDITASNPNHASFRYGNGTAELYYHNAVVGEAAIPAGEIKGEGSVRMDVVLTVLANRLIGDSAVYADVIAGKMDLTTYTTMAGRVTVLGIIKHHLVSYTTCDVRLNISNRTVENSDCRYRTKL